MKHHLFAAAVVLLTCGGCVGYYGDPYSYGPYYYPYSSYYYPSYRTPTVYYDPGWALFYPSFYFGSGYYGHYGYRGYRGYPGYRGYRGFYHHRGGWH